MPADSGSGSSGSRRAFVLSAAFFLSASPLLSLLRDADEGKAESKVEPYTSTAFEVTRHGMPLVGLGARYKYSFFAVYAYAMYAPQEVWAADNVFEAIAKAEKKQLHLIFQRDITGEDMKEALNVSMGPRIDASDAKGQAALQKFFAQFEGLKLSTNSRLEFRMQHCGTLTYLNGEFLTEIHSSICCYFS